MTKHEREGTEEGEASRGRRTSQGDRPENREESSKIDNPTHGLSAGTLDARRSPKCSREDWMKKTTM